MTHQRSPATDPVDRVDEDRPRTGVAVSPTHPGV
jgi:hypothetical protein